MNHDIKTLNEYVESLETRIEKLEALVSKLKTCKECGKIMAGEEHVLDDACTKCEVAHG